MMARSTSLQSKAGYIDARPLTTNPSKSSCYARPDHTFGSRVDGALARTFLRRCSIGRVRLRVRPVCAARMAAGPNALRGLGPNPSLAFDDAMTQAGSPNPRNDRICIMSSCPRHLANSSDLPSRCWRLCGCGKQPRFPEPLATNHHGPGHASDFVGECYGSDFGRPTPHQAIEPQPLGAVLACISDDSHSTSDQQPSQMSIALL